MIEARSGHAVIAAGQTGARIAAARPRGRSDDGHDDPTTTRPPSRRISGALRVPCVAIDEARRAIFGEDGVKNPDFLLYPRFSTNLVVEVKGKREQERTGPARLGKLGHDRRPGRPGALAVDVRARFPVDSGVRLCRGSAGVSASPRRRVPSSFAGWNTASGRLAWTITLPTCGRAGRPGRRWPWPARRFAAGFARSRNGCR